MTSTATSVDEYIAALPAERKQILQNLRDIFLENLPPGFSEVMSYGMVGFVVPHDLYPAGYHCDPKLPLPFINIASQKNFIAIYHMGIYADPILLAWFQSEYAKVCPTKLDMGKSCIRFKKMEDIPFELIAKLATKMSPEQWITLYVEKFKSK